jgi:hypothetical protein
MVPTNAEVQQYQKGTKTNCKAITTNKSILSKFREMFLENTFTDKFKREKNLIQKL